MLAEGKNEHKSIRRGGGFGIPPAHILEALSLREIFHNVEHWQRRHVFNVIFPNEPLASVFNSEDDPETLFKDTVLHGKKVNWGCKQGCQTVTLMRHFNRKVGSCFDGSERFSITVIKYELTDPSDIITAYPSS